MSNPKNTFRSVGSPIGHTTFTVITLGVQCACGEVFSSRLEMTRHHNLITQWRRMDWARIAAQYDRDAAEEFSRLMHPLKTPVVSQYDAEMESDAVEVAS